MLRNPKNHRLGRGFVDDGTNKNNQLKDAFYSLKLSLCAFTGPRCPKLDKEYTSLYSPYIPFWCIEVIRSLYQQIHGNRLPYSSPNDALLWFSCGTRAAPLSFRNTVYCKIQKILVSTTKWRHGLTYVPRPQASFKVVSCIDSTGSTALKQQQSLITSDILALKVLATTLPGARSPVP